MSETFSPNPEAEEQVSENTESRFGDKEHIIEVMRSGEPHVIGNIDELYPDEIAAHQNVVEVIQLLQSKFDQRDNSNNITEPVMLRYGSEQPMLCIFKPYDGENESTKKDHNITSLYPREVAGYRISEHFGFDLVPPTAIREVGGRIGALQLFLEPPQYISGEKYFEKFDETEWGKIQKSPDYYKLAAFDYLLGNTDRKDANYLLQVNENRGLAVDTKDEARIIAIDHGLTLDTFTFASVEIMGPILELTYDNKTKKPKNIQLPSWLHAQLENGQKHQEELNLTYLPDIPEHQIEDMWQRAKNLTTTGCFLSPENHKLFIKK